MSQFCFCKRKIILIRCTKIHSNHTVIGVGSETFCQLCIVGCIFKARKQLQTVFLHFLHQSAANSFCSLNVLMIVFSFLSTAENLWESQSPLMVWGQQRFEVVLGVWRVLFFGVSTRYLIVAELHSQYSCITFLFTSYLRILFSWCIKKLSL